MTRQQLVNTLSLIVEWVERGMLDPAIGVDESKGFGL